MDRFINFITEGGATLLLLAIIFLIIFPFIWGLIRFIYEIFRNPRKKK